MAASLAAALALRERGAEVAIVKADVSLRDDVAASIAFARRRFGALHGVIHAAGVLDPTSVIEKTQASAHRVFAAKALGAFHLDTLLRDDDLDLFMPVSSQASQVPEPGQVDYAAANAVLDVIADNRARRGRGYAGTIGWGPWQDVGVAADRMRQAVDAGAGRAMSAGRGVRDVEYDALDHPVLRARARESDGTLAYRGVLRHGHWLVDDHTLDGRPLLVGTAHLQLVATACADHLTGAGALEMVDVAHQRPLFPGRARHRNRGAIRARPRRRAVPAALAAARLARELDRQHDRRGEAHRGRGPRAACATAARSVRTPGGPAVRRRAPARRPALELDAALDRAATALRGSHRRCPRRSPTTSRSSTCIGAVRRGDPSCVVRRRVGRVIPHTYDAVRVHAPLEREIVVMVKPRASGTTTVADLVIQSGDGRLLCEVDGCVMRPAGARGGSARVARDPADAAPARGAWSSATSADLDSIGSSRSRDAAPGPGEVEIEVRATGLNFRDLLSVLGEMPNVASGMTPGSELAGVVTAVGAGVKRLSVGDAVRRDRAPARSRRTSRPRRTQSPCCRRTSISGARRACRSCS
jgi:hypothetical protein